MLFRSQVKEYKEHYNLINRGDYYRLSSPYGKCRAVAWAFVSPDQEECLFCGVMTCLQSNPDGTIIKLKGLNPKKTYQVGEQVYTGEALMYGGILLPVPKEEYQSWRYEIKAVK